MHGATYDSMTKIRLELLAHTKPGPTVQPICNALSSPLVYKGKAEQRRRGDRLEVRTRSSYGSISRLRLLLSCMLLQIF
jgi:hypothetical protein